MRLWKTWFMHNLVAHPLSEVVYQAVRPFDSALAEKWSGVIHDSSIPKEYLDGQIPGRG